MRGIFYQRKNLRNISLTNAMPTIFESDVEEFVIELLQGQGLDNCFNPFQSFCDNHFADDYLQISCISSYNSGNLSCLSRNFVP